MTASKTQSEAAKKRWANPEYKARMKARMAEYMHTPEFKAKIAATSKGRIWNKEQRAQHSEMMRKQWADPDSKFNSVETRHKLSEATKRQLASGNHSYFNTDNLMPSSYESIVAEALDCLDIAYVQQYKPQGHFRIYDLYLPTLNILVEVDGNYWHNSEHAVSKGQPCIDAEKQDWALVNGYGFMRIGEDCVKFDNLPQLLNEAIEQYIKEQSHAIL